MMRIQKSQKSYVKNISTTKHEHKQQTQKKSEQNYITVKGGNTCHAHILHIFGYLVEWI